MTNRRVDASFDPGLLLDRFVIAEGIDAWIATGRGRGYRAGVSSDRIEIDMQLVGRSTRGARVLGRGMLHHTNAAEPYSISYTDDEPFVGMGITIDSSVIREKKSGEELRVGDAGAASPELVAVLEELYECWCTGEPLPLAAVEGAVKRHLARVCELREGPLVRARQTLEDYFDRELYLAHIAEDLGMGGVRFLREFARHYGTTPVRHRTAVRVTRAGRLAWSRPDLTVPELARAVGIEHVGFFHRTYRAHFGATPAVHRLNRRLPPHPRGARSRTFSIPIDYREPTAHRACA